VVRRHRSRTVGARPTVGLGLVLLAALPPFCSGTATPAMAAGASDAAEARLIAVTTTDNDADGRIDALQLTASAPLHSTRARSATIVVSDQASRRLLIRVGDSRGQRFAVSLAGRWEPDSGARPLVAYAPPGVGVRAHQVRGGVRAADGARPVLTGTTAADADGNGLVDSVDLHFSATIRIRTGARAASIVQLAGHQVAGAAAQVNSRTVRVRLRAQLNDGVRPTIRLLATDAGPLSDAAGHGPRSAAKTLASPARDIPAVVHPDAPASPGAAEHATSAPAGTDDSGRGTDAPAPPGPALGALPFSSARPTDAWYQTGLEFGERSHWLQPWRGYFETVPAAKLLGAVGINFNVGADDAAASAQLLAASGVRRARVEIGWGKVDYDDANRLTDDASVVKKLKALRANGIRPLILLNANHGVPCPTRSFDAQLAEPARAGDRVVHVTAGTASRIMPGRSGLNGVDSYKAAEYIFTSVDHDGTATLSKPLDRDLPAGQYTGVTLRYAPFAPPFNPDGSPNAAFEETLRGWLDYVRVVTRRVGDVLGTYDFDIEIWNELTFGSDFLDIANYYDPAPQGSGAVDDELLRRTVAWLRDPANGVSGVGIGDGFANQRPWESGTESPAGLTAIDKHPYNGMKHFPRDASYTGVQPLDALGRPGGVFEDGRWRDDLVPRYDSFFPEYFLTAIQTEHLVRDISPFTTELYRVPHGRSTHPPDSAPPTMWLTELNMDPTGADPADPSNPGGPPLARLTEADTDRLQAKSVMRALSAYVNKGVSAIDFFAARGESLGLVDPSFFDALQRAPQSYPGDQAGGLQMQALHRFTSAFEGADPPTRSRQLSLLDVASYSNAKQFEGDGTAAHPPLYDRDVLGVFPFQVSDTRFVIPVYVMTRNVANLYRPNAPQSDTTRYDLPPETFRLTIGGIHGSAATVSGYDPLTDQSVPVRVVSNSDGRLVVELPVTDSPRLLSVRDAG
jgi:hypothetical protein